MVQTASTTVVITSTNETPASTRARLRSAAFLIEACGSKSLLRKLGCGEFVCVIDSTRLAHDGSAAVLLIDYH